MKHFLVKNLLNGTSVKFTEAGYNGAKADKRIGPTIELVGECDESGRLLTKIAAGNFTAPPPPPKVDPPPAGTPDDKAKVAAEIEEKIGAIVASINSSLEKKDFKTAKKLALQALELDENSEVAKITYERVEEAADKAKKDGKKK